jgi:hypothetical protein
MELINSHQSFEFMFLAVAAQYILPARYEAAGLYTSVSVGTPPQTFKVMVDTGSSMFWIRSKECTGASCANWKKYNAADSSTFANLNIPGKVSFSDGSSVSCTVGTDNVQIGNIPIPNQKICLAHTVLNFKESYDGIIGLPPPQLVNPVQLLPNKVANIHEGLTPLKLNLVSFVYNKKQGLSDDTDGSEIIIGSLDVKKYVGLIPWIGLTSDRTHWQILLEDLSYDGASLTKKFPVIVDTGATLSSIPKIAFDAIKNACGATLVKNLYVTSCYNAQNIKPLVFSFGKIVIKLHYKQFVKRMMTQVGDSSSDTCHLIFKPTDASYGKLGSLFLSSFYTIFDYDKARIGLAKLVTDSDAAGDLRANFHDSNPNAPDFAEKAPQIETVPKIDSNLGVAQSQPSVSSRDPFSAATGHDDPLNGFPSGSGDSTIIDPDQSQNFDDPFNPQFGSDPFNP